MHVGPAVRRFVARHRWVRPLVAGGLAAAVAGSLWVQAGRVDEARRRWDEQRPVLVADGAHAPGDVLRTRRRDLPLAAIPTSAIDQDVPVDGFIVRQRLADGEVVVDVDVAPPTGPAALADEGTVTVAVGDALVPSAPIGAPVTIAADGITIADRATVVGSVDGVVFVAVEAEAGPLVALAAQQRTASILFTR